MAWALVLVGMVFSIGLILIKSPSPMLIAVGMYLPLQTTAAIFVGGVIKYIVTRIYQRRKLSKELAGRGENVGILLASGLIAGEALTGVLIAALVVADIHLPAIGQNPLGGLVVFALLAAILIGIPLRSLKGGTAQSS